MKQAERFSYCETKLEKFPYFVSTSLFFREQNEEKKYSSECAIIYYINTRKREMQTEKKKHSI